MASIHPNESVVTLVTYPEIWGDFKSIIVERRQGTHILDSVSINNEEEAEDFVKGFLIAMHTLDWNNG